MILVLDNYDSFTYNLVQYLGELGADLQVKRNDEISLDEIRALKPERILVSPGPCSPRESGLSGAESKRPAVPPSRGAHLFSNSMIEQLRMTRDACRLTPPWLSS